MWRGLRVLTRAPFNKAGAVCHISTCYWCFSQKIISIFENQIFSDDLI